LLKLYSYIKVIAFMLILFILLSNPITTHSEAGGGLLSASKDNIIEVPVDIIEGLELVLVVIKRLTS
jgi:hypothetical protein